MRTLLLCILVTALVACGDIESDRAAAPTVSAATPVSDRERQLKREAADVIGVNGRQFYLRAHVWRNLAPFSPDTSVRARLAVVPVDPRYRSASGRLSNRGSIEARSLRITRAWLFLGDQVWAASGHALSKYACYDGTAVIARRGPLWPCDAPVDIVIQVEDEDGGRHYLRTLACQIAHAS
jgi:hypothetical protein